MGVQLALAICAHAVQLQPVQQFCFHGNVLKTRMGDQQTGNAEIAELLGLISIEVI